MVSNDSLTIGNRIVPIIVLAHGPLIIYWTKVKETLFAPLSDH